VPSVVAIAQPAVDDSGLVLVIDDEEAVREAVTDILEAAGYSVITAINGEAGLAVYRERQTDVQLVLLDLSMPGLSGEATLHQLREINPKAVVLLSSGYHPSEVARRFSDYGSVGFLQKPYDVDSLIREVRRYIER
jgi:DNA-binding NtrC family response regulator